MTTTQGKGSSSSPGTSSTSTSAEKPRFRRKADVSLKPGCQQCYLQALKCSCTSERPLRLSDSEQNCSRCVRNAERVCTKRTLAEALMAEQAANCNDEINGDPFIHPSIPHKKTSTEEKAKIYSLVSCMQCRTRGFRCSHASAAQLERPHPKQVCERCERTGEPFCIIYELETGKWKSEGVLEGDVAERMEGLVVRKPVVEILPQPLPALPPGKLIKLERELGVRWRGEGVR